MKVVESVLDVFESAADREFSDDAGAAEAFDDDVLATHYALERHGDAESELVHAGHLPDDGTASHYLIARRDVAGYNAYNEKVGAIIQAYYFANLYRSKPAGQAMLRDPLVKAKLVDYGFVAYWREKGWPAGCRPLGDTDFECGIVAAAVP